MRQDTAASKNLVDRLQLQVTEHGSDLGVCIKSPHSNLCLFV